MKVYTQAEYEQIHRESLLYEQINSNLQGFDEVSAHKDRWSERKYCSANLSSGIRIEVFDEQFHLDCHCSAGNLRKLED